MTINIITVITIIYGKVGGILTRHDHKGTLWLHGYQTGAEDGGRVSS